MAARRLSLVLCAVTRRKFDIPVVCYCTQLVKGHLLRHDLHQIQAPRRFSTNTSATANNSSKKNRPKSPLASSCADKQTSSLLPQDIPSLNNLIKDAVRRKDGELYKELMIAKVKEQWRLENRTEAMENLKNLYVKKDRLLMNCEIRSDVRRLFQTFLQLAGNGSVSTDLLEFAKWAGEHKGDWKPMSLIWFCLLQSEIQSLRKEGIQLFQSYSADLGKNARKRILSCSDFSAFSEDALSHLVEVSLKHSIADALPQVCGELLKKLCEKTRMEEANELLKLASLHDISIPTTSMDAYVTMLDTSNKLIPLDVIASRHKATDTEAADFKTEKPHIDLENIMVLTKEISMKNCPSFDNCLRLLRPLAEHGHVQHVQKVIRIVQNVHPRQFIKEGELKRYLAEALWKSGKTVEAILCIKNGCEKYKTKNQVVRLLRNVFCVCAVKTSTYSDKNVVEMARWFGAMGDFKPLTVVWRHLVTSESFDDYQLGERLFDQYANDMRDEIPQVMNDIIKSPPSEEALRRFIEAALKLDLRSFVSQLYSLLLDNLCFSNNIILADEVFNSAAGLGINIEETSLRRYLILRKKSLDIVAPFAKKKSRVQTTMFQLKF